MECHYAECRYAKYHDADDAQDPTHEVKRMCSTLVDSGRSSTHYTSLKNLAGYKHSSFFCFTVSEREKRFITLTPGQINPSGKDFKFG